MSVDDATWGEIRRCYCDGEMSVARVAARFGVSVGAVRYRARRDAWVRRVPVVRAVKDRCVEAGGVGAPVAKASRSAKAKTETKASAKAKAKAKAKTQTKAKTKKSKRGPGRQRKAPARRTSSTRAAPATRSALATRAALATRDEVVERLYQAIVMKLVSLEARMESQAEEQAGGEPSIDAAQSERETRELSTMIRSFEKVTEVAADIAKQSKPKSGARSDDGIDSNDAERMREEIAERLERLHAQRDAAGGSGGDGAQ